MENTRPTKEITTTGGHKVVYKTYLTGREANEIQKVMLKNVTMELKGKEPSVSGFNGASIAELSDKTIELMVVSVDGSATNVLDALLDLPNKDYLEAKEMIDKEIAEKKN